MPEIARYALTPEPDSSSKALLLIRRLIVSLYTEAVPTSVECRDVVEFASASSQEPMLRIRPPQTSAPRESHPYPGEGSYLDTDSEWAACARLLRKAITLTDVQEPQVKCSWLSRC